MDKKRVFLLSIALIITFACNNSKINNDNDENKSENNHLTDSSTESKNIEILSPEQDLYEIGKYDKYLSELGLINIKDSLPDIKINLKYATNDNFIGYNFYGDFKSAFVQEECYLKLKNAHQLLKSLNPEYSFVIFDAIRPIEYQQIMWDSLDFPERIKHFYVANPKKGSIHNYGMAIDISLIDKDGNELDLGTHYDYFGELAYPNKSDYFYKNNQLNDEQYKNRKLLQNVMETAGFSISTTEWWHFNACSLKYAKGKYKIFSLDNN